ncbi:unnamed protein product, partial [Medioppia subpectinata]
TAFGLWKHSCGESSVNRIANGDSTATGEWPWVVKLKFCNMESCSNCGGSLISDQWVLTAAHCTTTTDKYIKAIFGGDDLTTQRNITVYPTQQNIYTHEKYNEDNKSIHNDIALIKLDDKLDLNINIQPICLSSNIILPDNPTCVAIGWGRTESDKPSKTLQKVKLPMVQNKKCDIQLCAKNTERANADVCKGDSGGPLSCQMGQGTWVQTGIASYVDGSRDCGMARKPSVFTRVSAYIDWIDAITAEPKLFRDKNNG